MKAKPLYNQNAPGHHTFHTTPFFVRPEATLLHFSAMVNKTLHKSNTKQISYKNSSSASYVAAEE